MGTYPYPLTWEPEIEKEGGRPLYRAIADALQRDIAAGALKPGDRLPAQREEAKSLGWRTAKKTGDKGSADLAVERWAQLAQYL